MNEINTDYLLSQIRSLGAALEQPPAIDESGAANAPNFSSLFKDTLDSVNELQAKSGDMKQAFETGTSDVGLAEVMIASQKADLSFRAMSEVRNKLVTAYQDIMNMPV